MSFALKTSHRRVSRCTSWKNVIKEIVPSEICFFYDLRIIIIISRMRVHYYIYYHNPKPSSIAICYTFCGRSVTFFHTLWYDHFGVVKTLNEKNVKSVNKTFLRRHKTTVSRRQYGLYIPNVFTCSQHILHYSSSLLFSKILRILELYLKQLY